jgi:hypothetical protein
LERSEEWKQWGRPRAELPAPCAEDTQFINTAKAVWSEATMKWIGEYIVDDAGQCRWHEGLRIQDEHIKSAYRKNSLIEFIIETSAVMGVKVGIA